MKTHTTALWIALSLVAASARGVAQQASAGSSPSQSGLTYEVWGTVVDRDGNPLVGAEVILLERDAVARLVRTDVRGHFRMDTLPSDVSLFRVRRVGYQPKLLQVRFTKSNRSTNMVVSLESAATVLDTVVVEADTEIVRPDSRLVGFYERLKSNQFGHFITEEMLARLRPHHTSEALRSVPGVVMRPSRRIGNIVRLRNCGVRGESADRVGPLVWVDGVRLPGVELDEITQGNDVAAIEVYNSFAGVPVQYFDRTAVCGTILIWTKSR
jgi:hypothetical protein